MANNPNPWWWNSAGYKDGKRVSGPIGLPLERRPEMRMVLSPSIASTVEEVVANAQVMRDGKFDTASLKMIKSYVKTEDPLNPYTDKQILTHLLFNEVYSFDARVIELARAKLGFKNYEERRKS